MNFLDSDLDPDEACEWTHKIAGTNQTLFSAPMRQSLHLLHLGSTLVRDVVEFVWEQLPEDATTSKYTMTFHKQARAISCADCLSGHQACERWLQIQGFRVR